MDPWKFSLKDVKAVMAEKLAELPDQGKRWLPYLGRLLEERGKMFYNMEDSVGITELIDSSCIN